MIDTYLKSKNEEDLLALRAFLTNITGPTRGHKANEEEGLSQAGDPNYFYVCIRFLAPIAPFGAIEACTPAEGEPVCGSWA